MTLPPSSTNESRIHVDFKAGDVEIITRTGVRFRTQSTILCRTSGFFASLLEHAQTETSAAKGGPAQIAVDEDERTVAILLKIVSGLPFLAETRDLGPTSVERLGLAAEKYEVSAALDVVRLSLQSSSLSLPEYAMQRYALASRFGWDDIANAAGRETLGQVLDYDSLPNMDMRHLTRLLSLRQRRIDMFVAVIQSTSGLFAFENNGNCRHSSKSHPAGFEKDAWFRLRGSIVAEMWRRPSGSDLFVDNAAIAAVRQATCRVHDRPIFDIDALKAKVETLVGRLPVDCCNA